MELPREYGKLHPTFHASVLKLHHGELPAKCQPVPIAADDVEFEVDKVLQKRVHGNRVEYLILWKGYPLHEATWEPASHLSNAKRAVALFEHQGVRTRKHKSNL